MLTRTSTITAAVAGDPTRARLLELAAARGVSLAALSQMLGRNSAYLQQFVKKGSPRKLEEGDRRTLARYFGVPESELGAPEDAPAAAALPQEWTTVPRLDTAASAGPGAHAEGEAAVGTLRFSARWLRGQGLDPSRLSAIAVAGDSMEPVLLDGDEILVDTTPQRLAPGAIHVVRTGDALLVKRVELPAPGRIRLVSENPGYAPLDLPVQEVTVLGRVVWKSGKVA